MTNTEGEFYASYRWCLNPILTFGDLVARAREELKKYPVVDADWQREEVLTNLYLFVAGITCMVDDYLLDQPWDLSKVSSRFPRVRPIVPFIQGALNLPTAIARLPRRPGLISWHQEWHGVVDRVCESLANSTSVTWEQLQPLQRDLDRSLSFTFPSDLLPRRLPIPAAYRNQDLAHYDVLSLVERFISVHPDPHTALAVVGLRTAGAYLAPLAKAYLSALGRKSVSWLTLRPKKGISGWESRQLSAIVSPETHVLLIDEPPNSGKTINLALETLRRFGVLPERTAILAPRNPARPDWDPAKVITDGDRTRDIALPPSDYYKARLLGSGQVETLLRDYYAKEGWEDVRIRRSDEVEAINQRLRLQHRNGYHVRLKRLLEVELRQPGREPAVRRVFAKSVGWGWFGYHAHLAAKALEGFVPPLLGLRHGILFTEWCDGDGGASASARDGVPVPRLAQYIARRTLTLRLSEDPCYRDLDYGWTGWRHLVTILRRPYGDYVGYIKMPAIHRSLRTYQATTPCLIDGKMAKHEWRTAQRAGVKVDFEHHNFGKTELNVVDPAYDLASAIFEFSLSSQSEEELLRLYVSQTGDTGVRDRLLLYKLLYASRLLERTGQQLSQEPLADEAQAWNLTHVAARRWLMAHLSRYCASLLDPSAPRWTRRLFFLDLDGVFDCELLGCPHTTLSGLLALSLLQRNGISVVINTGRSVQHVREYCRTYRLPGGVAEYGCVFFDATTSTETSLIDDDCAPQLFRCRDALLRVPGVFLDPEYRYALRAYRYANSQTVPLTQDEVAALLDSGRYDRLRFITTPIDTILLPADTNKGSALLAVKGAAPSPPEIVVAIGDSDRDIDMLRAADVSFAPGSCSAGVRALANEGRCRIMRRPLQRGLLEAAQTFLKDLGVDPASPTSANAIAERANRHIVGKLLGIADRTRPRQYLSILTWRSL